MLPETGTELSNRYFQFMNFDWILIVFRYLNEF